MAGGPDPVKTFASGAEHRGRFGATSLSRQAVLQDIFFLWRPFLPDPNDDMILELAFAANCRYIVTHNVRHFRGCERLGVEVVTPGEFLKTINQSPKS